MLQDSTAWVSLTPPPCEHPYEQNCWAPCTYLVIHINLQTVQRMKPHKIFFSESTTEGGGDGRRWYFGQDYCRLVQSDEVASWSKKCKQHCPCTCMPGCSFLLILQRGSRQGVCLRTYNLQVWWVFSWDSYSLLIWNSHRYWWDMYYILVLSVIASLPEAEQTWSQGYQNTSTG